MIEIADQQQQNFKHSNLPKTQLTLVILIILLMPYQSSSISLRFLRHAVVDCRNGLYINHAQIYPVVGISNSSSNEPTNECIEHNPESSPFVRIFRAFDTCGIQLSSNGYFKVYVRFGIYRPSRGITWVIYDRVDCPADALPPLLSATMTVSEEKSGKYEDETFSNYHYYYYTVTVGTHALLTDERMDMEIKFCKAYENTNDFHYLIVGRCISRGETISLVSKTANETKFLITSPTRMNRIVCRLSLTRSNGTSRKFERCGLYELAAEEMNVFDDTLYDAGLSINCARNQSDDDDDDNSWPKCNSQLHNFSLSFIDDSRSAAAFFRFRDKKDSTIEADQDQSIAKASFRRRSENEGHCPMGNFGNALGFTLITGLAFITGAALPIAILCCFRAIHSKRWRVANKQRRRRQRPNVTFKTIDQTEQVVNGQKRLDDHDDHDI